MKGCINRKMNNIKISRLASFYIFVFNIYVELTICYTNINSFDLGTNTLKELFLLFSFYGCGN